MMVEPEPVYGVKSVEFIGFARRFSPKPNFEISETFGRRIVGGVGKCNFMVELGFRVNLKYTGFVGGVGKECMLALDIFLKQSLKGLLKRDLAAQDDRDMLLLSPPAASISPLLVAFTKCV